MIGQQDWISPDTPPTVRDFIELYSRLGEPPERAYERAHQDVLDLQANRYPLTLPSQRRACVPPLARLAPLVWLGVASFFALPWIATIVVAVPLVDYCWIGK